MLFILMLVFRSFDEFLDVLGNALMQNATHVTPPKTNEFGTQSHGGLVQMMFLLKKL